MRLSCERRCFPRRVVSKEAIYPMSVEDANNYDVNTMVIRLAEMYLTFAECALKTGSGKEEALRYINAIRERSGMPR